MRCEWKACPYPASVRQECRYHSVFFNYPVSLTGRHISIADLYNAENPTGATLYVSRPGELNSDRGIYMMRGGSIVRDADPYTDVGWGIRVARAQAELRMQELRRIRAKTSHANGLTAGFIVMPDGVTVRAVAHPPFTRESESAKAGAAVPGTPIANHNNTGAFILWKGFGKRKVRKSQRRRPAGWHGNHPEQKPRERFGKRESIADLPIWTPPAKEPPRVEVVEIECGVSEDDERDQIIATLQDEDFPFEETA